MLKYLATNFKKSEIEAIGFDLDGTLYDEFEFISQLFLQLSQEIAAVTGMSPGPIYTGFCSDWLIEGNSSSFFQSFLKKTGFQGNIESAASMCVKAYRDFSPDLKLPSRMAFILEQLTAEGYPLFLISDGNSALQRRKIASLGLHRFFAPENIAITGDYGPEYRKPSVKIVPYMKLLSNIKEPGRVLFTGDRACDREFAVNAGFRFVTMRNTSI